MSDSKIIVQKNPTKPNSLIYLNTYLVKYFPNLTYFLLSLEMIIFLFQMEENTIGNPWMVENINVFSYFCCPECEFQGKTEKLFEEHALENHPMAKDFFIKIEESATDATPVTFDINLGKAI